MAEADGAVVGTGVLSVHGPVAWIGTIFVEPAWRRRGVGMAITRATIETAEAAGCRTLVLVATEAGRPMYETARVRGPDRRTGSSVAPGLPVTSRDRPAGAAYRRGRPCGDHAPWTLPPPARTEATCCAPSPRPTTTRVLDDGDGSLGGFVVRAPWGGGATIAPDPDDALAILRARRVAAGTGSAASAPACSPRTKPDSHCMLADGWTESWRAPRLVRGDPLRWQPDAIWGQFNHAFG